MIYFLNFGFIAVLIATAFRYFYSKHLGIPFAAIFHPSELQLWIYWVSLFWLFLSFWNVSIRRQCPRCGATKYRFLGEREIDRWVGPKKVTKERETKTVSTTFVKIEKIWECRLCGNNWGEVEIKKKE